jgi:hypothetical protein
MAIGQKAWAPKVSSLKWLCSIIGASFTWKVIEISIVVRDPGELFHILDCSCGRYSC